MALWCRMYRGVLDMIEQQLLLARDGRTVKQRAPKEGDRAHQAVEQLLACHEARHTAEDIAAIANRVRAKRLQRLRA